MKAGGDTPCTMPINITGTSTTVYSDIPEGCVLVGPQFARIFTFSDRLLTILHAMYLVSTKDALNKTKTTVF